MKATSTEQDDRVWLQESLFKKTHDARFSLLLHHSYNQNCRWYGKDVFTEDKTTLNIKSEDNSFTKKFKGPILLPRREICSVISPCRYVSSSRFEHCIKRFRNWHCVWLLPIGRTWNTADFSNKAHQRFVLICVYVWTSNLMNIDCIIVSRYFSRYLLKPWEINYTMQVSENFSALEVKII